MTKPAVLMYLSKKNWYSFVPLINSLEEAGTGEEILLTSDPLRDLPRVLGSHRPVILCVSFYSTQVSEVRRLVSAIRSEFGDGVRLLAGGPHPTGARDGTLKMGFDAVVQGEGEIVFPSVIRSLVDGTLEDRSIFKGEPLRDLDAVSPVSFKHKLFPPLEISRGCLFGCKYCAVPRNFGKVRHRSLSSIVKAGRMLLKLRSRWDFRFLSPNSFGYGSLEKKPKEEKVRDLLGSLRNLEGDKRIFFATFPSEGRPDFVTEEMIDIIARYADNRKISIGGQSGSDRILRSIGRGHDVATILRASELILQAGLVPVVDFILGLPGEKESDQDRTLEVMRDLAARGTEMRIHHFLPLPGSPMGNMRPSRIPERIISEIGRLSLRGVATGSFNEQMRLAREMSSLAGNKIY